VKSIICVLFVLKIIISLLIPIQTFNEFQDYRKLQNRFWLFFGPIKELPSLDEFFIFYNATWELSIFHFIEENFIHYFLSVEKRKEKSLFISGSFFFFFPNLRSNFCFVKWTAVLLKWKFDDAELSQSRAIQSINFQRIIPIL
jgi:hypothetical protein